jgi:hypothetical protein
MPVSGSVWPLAAAALAVAELAEPAVLVPPDVPPDVPPAEAGLVALPDGVGAGLGFATTTIVPCMNGWIWQM